jgi:predicted Rossmann-fold nucleotide-binding protein
VLLLNVKGFWDPFLALLRHHTSLGFIPPNSFAVLVADRPEQIMPALHGAVRAISDEELRGSAAEMTAEKM